MASADEFEETINNFTRAKTGEKIYIDLATQGVVELRPLCKDGSVTLGAFWVHVLQHSNNYPVHTHPYRKLYRSGHEYELQLRIDDISITINLATGHLKMKGPHVIDWFVTRFPGIIEGYSFPPGHHSKKLRDVYTLDQMKAAQNEMQNYYKRYIEDWPLEVFRKNANVMELVKKREYYEPINPEGFLRGDDLETFNPISDLLEVQETEEQLQRLKPGRIIQGHVLYRLWRSSLNSWFSNENARLFIVTPSIDCDRLTDVCLLFINHKQMACLDTFCIRLSNLYEKFAEVRRDAIKRFSSKDQVFIEYKIFNSIVFPAKNFTTSFIAMIKGGKARILQTSTNFDKASFSSLTTSTVQYTEMDEEYFLKAYVNPILA